MKTKNYAGKKKGKKYKYGVCKSAGFAGGVIYGRRKRKGK